MDELPLATYLGKYYYYTDFIDCAMACEKLLYGNQAESAPLVIGFDMEWPFNFKTGSGKSALIQLSPSLDICYLLHVYELQKLPATLTELLKHRNVTLTGVNVKNDIRKLARDFPGIDEQPMLDNCIDCRSIGSGSDDAELEMIKQWSMQKLVNYFFKETVNKDGKVRRSRWDLIPLSNTQKLYAATDSYLSLKLYLHIKELITTKENTWSNI